MKTRPQEPCSNQEWQEVVDMAHVFLAVDSARKYGLVTGGPEIDVDRCVDLIERGRAHGIAPRADAIERILPSLVKRS